MLWTILSRFWALFLGIALLNVSIGLHGSLLGLRATLEGFSASSTGFVMSAYFVGFLISSIVTLKMVFRVGHVRVFAALASLASVALLLHSVFVYPLIWGFFRLITGFCYAGLYMVSESWLNDKADNQTRGGILSIYTLVGLMGMSGGQLFLNFADPEGYKLFILVSALVSLALVPILLSVSPAPIFEAPSHLDLKTLFSLAPLGVTGAFICGMANGGLLSMGAFYATRIGFSVAETSIFMGVAILGGGLMQWPIGRLSDFINRRTVIMVTAFLAAATAGWAALITGHPGTALLWVTGLYGGFSLPIYSLCSATTNDGLRKDQMVSAGGALILVTGTGAVLGPILVAQCISFLGPSGFFLFFMGIHSCTVAFALLRMTLKAPFPLEEQNQYRVVPYRATPMSVVLAQESEHGH